MPGRRCGRCMSACATRARRCRCARSASAARSSRCFRSVSPPQRSSKGWRDDGDRRAAVPGRRLNFPILCKARPRCLRGDRAIGARARRLLLELIEVITAEQMLDAYSSVGMPLVLQALVVRQTLRFRGLLPQADSWRTIVISTLRHASPISWKKIPRPCRHW